MYSQDMPILREHGLASPAGLRDLCMFAILSANQPFDHMDMIFGDWKREGAASQFLTKHKRAGHVYLTENAERIHHAMSHEYPSAEGVMWHLVQIPALGLVKGGFVCQMLGLNAACLDRQNVARVGLRLPRLNKKATVPTIARKIDEYLALCSEFTPERWWDDWCDWMTGESFQTPDEVSEFHLKAMQLRRT